MGAAAAVGRREELGHAARLAHELDRHADMFELVNMLAKMGGIQMNVVDEKKHLLFIAYRSTFSDKHGKLRRIRAMLEQEDDPKRVQCLVSYLGWLEDDMQAACRVALDVLDNHLLPSCSNVAENAALLRVLYNKMKGDAYWFMGMLDKEEDKEHLAHMVLGAYEAASEAAEGLSPAHPLRLALRLNMTVLYHDIMKWNERAISLANLSLYEAGPELESYIESTETVKLMNENLKQWTSDDPKIIKGPVVDENTLAPPPPVVPRSNGGPPLDKFTSPGDYQVHDGLSATAEIRSRKKPAKMMRGHKDSVSREGLVFVASTAKKLYHTSVMLETVNMVAELNLELTPEERDLLSIAYKDVFSKKYKDLRAISGREEDHVKAYRGVLEDDMERTCRNVLNIVQRHLLPFCCGAQEDVVLYTKMMGDIYWFLAMLSKVPADKELLAESTLAAYESASKAAESLSPAHPLRLAVYLTKTSFYYDVMNWPERAYDVAKQALEKASPRKLALLGEESESHRQSTRILELIDENLKKWRPITKEASSSLNEVKEASSSATPPPPSVAAAVVCLDFTSLRDWGYDFHERLSEREIRSRRKHAQLVRSGSRRVDA